MTKATSSVSIEQIIQFLANEFIAPDNIPEDTCQRNDVCMEARASALIDSCPLGELARFFRTDLAGSTLHLPLRQPLKLETTMHDSRGSRCYQWTFDHYVVTASGKPTDYLGQSGRWRLHEIPPPPPRPTDWKQKTANEEILSVLRQTVSPSPSPENFEWVLLQSKDEISNDLREYFGQRSVFQLAKPLTMYNTPERVCHFFGNAALPFAPLKQPGDQLRMEYDISKGSDAVEPNTGQTEVETLHEYLKDMFSARRLPAELLAQRSRQYEGWLQFIFPFTDSNSNVIMSVIKRYGETFQTKSFLPITRWGRTHSSDRCCLAIPCRGPQPLYHLYELTENKDAIVILTDSLEIAALNQASWKPADVIFTSFICDPGHYEQLDWSPLKDRKQIYYLLTNHSGKTFEEACLEAGKLVEYLNSKSIELQFIRMPIWYCPLPILRNIQNLISAQYAAKPQAYQGGARVLMPEEFEAMRQIVTRRIDSPPEAWWRTEQEASAPTNRSPEISLITEGFDYILWPLLVRGKSTMLYARKGLGKSALTHSIAACLSGEAKPRLFAENWWGATKSNHKSYKVLYLDFENQETGHQDLLKRMCYPYWRTEKTKRAEDAENFIWKNMPKEGLSGINLALPEYHQKLWDMIDTAKGEGEPGHAVDVLIIDTYHEFVNNADEVNTHRGLRELLRTLSDRGITTLILNHPKADDSTKMSGHNSILESFFYVMNLNRSGNRSHPLSEPITVSFNATRSGWLATNQDEFKIYQPKSPGEWHLYSPKCSAEEERNRIREHYMKVEKYSKNDVAKLLGTSAATLYRAIPEKNKV